MHSHFGAKALWAAQRGRGSGQQQAVSRARRQRHEGKGAVSVGWVQSHRLSSRLKVSPCPSCRSSELPASVNVVNIPAYPDLATRFGAFCTRINFRGWPLRAYRQGATKTRSRGWRTVGEDGD